MVNNTFPTIIMTLKFKIRKPWYEPFFLLKIYLFIPFCEKEGFELACSESYIKIVAK